MKKFLALICAIAMIMSFSTVAFADEMLFNQVTTYDATSEYYMELNKPLDVLSYITDLMFTDEMTKIDMQYLIESILKSKMTFDVKADVDVETFKKIKTEMKMNFNIPANISEDIKLSGDLTIYLWMDMDLTAGNEKYLIVFKNPLNGKYLYMNLFDEEVFGKDVVEELKVELGKAFESIDLTNYMADVTKLTNDMYLKHAVVKEEGNTVTVTYTNDALIDSVFDLVEGMLDMDSLKGLAGDAELSIDKGEFAKARALVKGLGIFSDKDAAVITYTKDAAGNILSMEEMLHFDFNIVELCSVFDIAEEDLYPIEKAKADIDLTLVAKADYKAYGDDVVFTMPELTEENSINLITLIMNEGNNTLQPEDDYYVEEEVYEYIPEYFTDWAMGAMRRSMYASVDDFNTSAGWDSDNLKLEYKNIDVNGEEKIQLVISSDYLAPVVIIGDTEHYEYTINGVRVNSGAGAPFMYMEGYNWDTYEKMDVLFVNNHVLEEVLDCKLESASMYYIDYETGEELENPEIEFYFQRKNPGFNE